MIMGNKSHWKFIKLMGDDIIFKLPITYIIFIAFIASFKLCLLDFFSFPKYSFVQNGITIYLVRS